MFYFRYNFPNKKRGFTIVELTVSLSIIVILLSLVMANYNAGLGSSSLLESQSSAFHNIKLAQSYALSSKSYNDVSPNHWGVYFAVDNPNIIIFADLNNNHIPDYGEYDPYLGGRTLSLSGDVTVNYISYSAPAISVLFTTGAGTMVIYDLGSQQYYSDMYQVELRDKNFDFGKLLIFSPYYLVDTQDCSCSDIDSFCCSFCESKTNCMDMENN